MTTNKTRPLTVVTRRAARIAASTLPTPDSAAFITTPPGPPTPLVRNTRSLRSLPVSTTQTSQRSLSGSTNPSPVRTAPIINNNNKRTAESSLPIRPRPPPPKPSPTLELNTLADIDDFLRQYARGLPCSARRIALLNLDLSHGHSIIQNPYTNLRFIEHRMLVGSGLFQDI
ncbi:hypothetical protein BC829DRAFT_399985 [Chytridium lagenaria]|nr:hypothetical protein BC829DRAFT_399985 [Chytridium lagenaria]